MSSDPEAPDHNDVAVVHATSMTDLLASEDPFIEANIRSLVMLVDGKPGVTSGWGSYLDKPRSTDSRSPTSTS
jgi:regulator of RNase E activity RraB